MQTLDSLNIVMEDILPKCEDQPARCVEEWLDFVNAYDELPITPDVADIHSKGQSCLGSFINWMIEPQGQERDFGIFYTHMECEELMSTCQDVADMGRFLEENPDVLAP